MLATSYTCARLSAGKLNYQRTLCYSPPDPHRGVRPWTGCWRTSVRQDPLIAHPWKKSRGRPCKTPSSYGLGFSRGAFTHSVIHSYVQRNKKWNDLMMLLAVVSAVYYAVYTMTRYVACDNANDILSCRRLFTGPTCLSIQGRLSPQQPWRNPFPLDSLLSATLVFLLPPLPFHGGPGYDPRKNFWNYRCS